MLGVSLVFFPVSVPIDCYFLELMYACDLITENASVLFTLLIGVEVREVLDVLAICGGDVSF